MVNKYKSTLYQIGSILFSLIFFSILQKLYLDRFSQSFHTYLKTVSPDAANPNFIPEMLSVYAISSFGNDSLVMVFIFPLFMAIGVLTFAVFLMSKRTSELNKELKEIKEKLNV